MAIIVEIQHTSSDPGERAEIAAHIEHVLSDQLGDWKVSIVGSQGTDAWEMKLLGPNGFERTYSLDGTQGECAPQAIARIIAKMTAGTAKQR